MAKKKFQIFISSTYLDLQDERQAAVEAILGSKHIPAGMELFRAGNASQLDTIKKWIDESDLYMLILGGRYGSIEHITGKSYTQLEYEYAKEKGVPLFAVILSDSFLHRKAASGLYEVFEKENIEKYNEFKRDVMTKVIKPVDDCKDIQIAIKDSISELESEYDLTGWVRATTVEDYTEVINENRKLLKENTRLLNELNKIKSSIMIGNYEFEELKEVLNAKIIKIPGKYLNDKEDKEMTALEFIVKFKNVLITGLSCKYSVETMAEYAYKHICPYFIQFGLLQINTANKERRIFMTKDGLNFIAKLEVEKKSLN